LRGYFARRKAKDEARLTPCEDANTAAREIDRKDNLIFKFVDHISRKYIIRGRD
jgi:hypothetical protein